MQAQIDIDSTYGDLLIPFILMGVGIALTMSPMSTAAMNAVAETKAGLASGLLSMSRMVGGTFGVAVLGAIFQAQGHTSLESSLAGSGVRPRRSTRSASSSAAAASTRSSRALPAEQAQQAADAAREAFVSSLATSIGISAAVAAAGPVLALVLISSKRRQAPGTARARHPAGGPRAGRARGNISGGSVRLQRGLHRPAAKRRALMGPHRSRPSRYDPGRLSDPTQGEPWP